MAESRKIRRYQMIACCEQGDERIELARGRGEAVQEHDLAVNASRDHELLGYLKTSLPHQPDDVEVPLQDIIELSLIHI